MKNEKPSITTVFTMVFEGLGFQDLLKLEDFQSKYALQNHSRSQLSFLLDFLHFWSTLVTFWGRFGALLESWGVSGLLSGEIGHRLASTWGPWVQLGRLGLPF